MIRWEPETCPPTWRRTESYRLFHVRNAVIRVCIIMAQPLNHFIEPRLMFLPTSNRRVQQSDHSSQTRRGEHWLCQCLFHWCECKCTRIKVDDFINAIDQVFWVFWAFFSTTVCLHPAFISHVTLQGYRQKDSYMASQGPLQHTIEDFWRMIWEWRSCSIVMLTELEERGQVCGCVQMENPLYWQELTVIFSKHTGSGVSFLLCSIINYSWNWNLFFSLVAIILQHWTVPTSI